VPIYRIAVNEANYFNSGMVVNEAILGFVPTYKGCKWDIYPQAASLRGGEPISAVARQAKVKGYDHKEREHQVCNGPNYWA